MERGEDDFMLDFAYLADETRLERGLPPNGVNDEFHLEIEELGTEFVTNQQSSHDSRISPIVTALRKLAAGQGGEEEVRSAVRAGKAAFRGGGSCTSPSREGVENGKRKEVTELLTWGKTSNYQLGFVSSHDDQPVPKVVRFPGSGIQIVAVSCSRFHSLAVSSCGNVFVWGFGGSLGRLGVGASQNDTKPIVVHPLRIREFGPRNAVIKAAAGLDHSLALTADGRIYTWGSNAKGQLGLKNDESGARAGSTDACVKRPLPLKGPFKEKKVVDVAAGADYSLCVVSDCTAWAWGSNACGSLGLGSPPVGPDMSPSPRVLPHLNNVVQVFAAPQGQCSLLLCANGEALVFGGASVGTGSKQANADTRFFTPSRLRRQALSGKAHDRKSESSSPAGSPTASNEWQTSKGGRATGATPLRSVTMGSQVAYAVDEFGCIWTWSLTAPRPCVAEPIEVKNGPEEGFGQVALADRSGWLWAVGSGGLWRLLGNSSEIWRAERYEEVDQVSFLACGPEHQAVVTSFYLEAPSTEQTAEQRFELEEFESTTTPGKLCSKVPTLEKLCERALCRGMSPSNFGVVCEVALQIRLPDLLDYSFHFLRANWQLMTTEAYLPTLAQLPFDVLAAKDMAFSGQWPKPSRLFEVDPYEFPPSDWLPSSPSHQAGESPLASPSGAVSSLRPNQCMSRRRGGGRKRSSQGTPKSSPLPPGASPVNAVAVSPASLPTRSRPLEVTVDEEIWIEVGQKGRRKSSGAEEKPADSPLKATAASPKAASPKGSWAPVYPWSAGAASDSSEQTQHPLPTLSEYVLRPEHKKANAKEGPSSILQQAMQQSVCQWAEQRKDEEKPSLLQILEEEKAAAPPRKSSDGLGAGPSNSKTDICSWGRDAMPSEKPKAESVYELQKAEELRKKQAEEEKELQEIQAMFAALEVAEQLEELERQGLSTAALTATAASAAPKGKASAKKKEDRDKKKRQPKLGNENGDANENHTKEEKKKRQPKWSNENGETNENEKKEEKEKKKRQPKWGNENGESGWWASSSWSKSKDGGNWTDSSWDSKKWQGEKPYSKQWTQKEGSKKSEVDVGSEA